jgi:hypothetical protein
MSGRVLKLGFSANGNIGETFVLSGDKQSDCKPLTIDGDKHTYAINLHQSDANNKYTLSLIDLTENNLSQCSDLTDETLQNLIPKTFINGAVTYNNGTWAIYPMSGNSVGNLHGIQLNLINNFNEFYHNYNLFSSHHYHNLLK